MEARIILVVIAAFLLTAFHGENFTSHQFAPEGGHGVFTAIATSGIVFSYLGFRQGIELAGETDNPKRNVPSRSSGRCCSPPSSTSPCRSPSSAR